MTFTSYAAALLNNQPLRIPPTPNELSADQLEIELTHWATQITWPTQDSNSNHCQPAIDQINANWDSKSETLDLTGLTLPTLPNILGRFAHLRWLLVSKSAIDQIPEQLKNRRDLTIIEQSLDESTINAQRRLPAGSTPVMANRANEREPSPSDRVLVAFNNFYGRKGISSNEWRELLKIDPAQLNAFQPLRKFVHLLSKHIESLIKDLSKQANDEKAELLRNAQTNLASCAELIGKQQWHSASECRDIQDKQLSDLIKAYASLANHFGHHGSANDRRFVDAIERIASFVVDCCKKFGASALLGKLAPHMTLLTRAFSRSVDSASDQAMRYVADAISQDTNLARYATQNLALLATAFSKRFEGDKRAEALNKIALLIKSSKAILPRANMQDRADLANAFARHAGENCNAAVSAIAADVLTLRHLGNSRSEHAVDLIHAFSRQPDRQHCLAATLHLVKMVMNQRNTLKASEITLIANGLMKWPGEIRCREYLRVHAKLLMERPALSRFNAKELASLMTSFSRDAENHYCRNAGLAITNYWLKHQTHTEPLAQFQLAMASSCWNDENCSKELIAAIVPGLASGDWLRQQEPEKLSLLVQLLDKPANQMHRANALPAIASWFVLAEGEPSWRWSVFSSQQATSLAHSFSKVGESPAIQDAINALVTQIDQCEWATPENMSSMDVALLCAALSACPEQTRHAELVSRWFLGEKPVSLETSRDLSMCVEALSKWPDDPGCQQAINALTTDINKFRGLSYWHPIDFVRYAIAITRCPAANRRELLPPIVKASSSWLLTNQLDAQQRSYLWNALNKSRDLLNKKDQDGLTVALNVLSHSNS